MMGLEPTTFCIATVVLSVDSALTGATAGVFGTFLQDMKGKIDSSWPKRRSQDLRNHVVEVERRQEKTLQMR